VPTVETEPNAYLERNEHGTWRIKPTRVSLDSVVHAYWQGESPETIRSNFPSLTLEQIYGTIAFYLRHREEFDAYLAEQAEEWEKWRTECEVRNRELRERVRERAATSNVRGANK
jgi:uncharacterized protein (DUF433 family)